MAPRYRDRFGDTLPPGFGASGKDGAGWGQEKKITFALDAMGKPPSMASAVTIIDNLQEQREALDEPSVRTITVGVSPRLSNGDGSNLADLHVLALIEFGLGGTRSGKAVVSVGRGTQICVPTNAYRVSAWIEQCPDMSLAYPALYPNEDDGVIISVFAMAAHGKRAGDLPFRNLYARFPSSDAAPPPVVFDVPSYARSYTLVSTNPTLLTNGNVQQIGHGGGVVQQNNTIAFGPSPPPVKTPILAITKQLSISVPADAVGGLMTLVCDIDVLLP